MSTFKCNSDCDTCDPAFLMLIGRSVPLERNSCHWRLFSGLESCVASCFIVFIGWRSFPGLLLKERKNKKIKVKSSDIFPEKRPPCALIGFMFFFSRWLTLLWHTDVCLRGTKVRQGWRLYYISVERTLYSHFNAFYFCAHCLPYSSGARKGFEFHWVSIFPAFFVLSWNNLPS